MSPSRDAIVATAGETIRRGSKSFHMSSRLFDRRTRERAWLLYAWCRACDDLMDGQVLGHAGAQQEGAAQAGGAQERLSLLRVQTFRALAGEEVGELPFDALRILDAECPLPRRFIEDHLEGFAMDARDWRPRGENDLLCYCYHVAGAVGCLMAVVMGVDPADADTLDRASDLGIAFQLANIARDLQEDAAVDRCYLPQEWLAEMDVPPGQHMTPAYRPRMAVLARRLCALADEYRRSSRVGAARLPFRARWAVLAAGNIYGEIAHEVARCGAHAWDRRVVIPRPRKMALAARGWAEARREPEGVSRVGLWTRGR